MMRNATLGAQSRGSVLDTPSAPPAKKQRLEAPPAPSTGAPSKPPLFGLASAPRGHPEHREGLRAHLREYTIKTLGVAPEDVPIGGEQQQPAPPADEHVPDPISNLTSSRDTTSTLDDEPPDPVWWRTMKTRAQLFKEAFGKPDLQHSFTQEACADTTLHFVLMSGYLTQGDKRSLFEASNPLVEHLDTMRKSLKHYDFRWLKDINTNWADIKRLAKDKAIAMMACLFFYDMDVSLLMRYLGGNYTAAHRNVSAIVDKIRPFVDPDLIPHFIRVMTVGCPNYFVAESTRENSLKYWRGGNNPSIAQHMDLVMKRW